MIGLLRKDGSVSGEASVMVDCEKRDWWLTVVSDDIDLLKLREDVEVVVVLKFLSSEFPKNELPFSLLIGNLKTLIHSQTILYSFDASSPKPKKAKNMILEAGIVHQRIMSWGGKIEVGNKPTREKLLWTFSQLIHGRRPIDTFEKMLNAVIDIPKTVSIKAIAMRRR